MITNPVALVSILTLIVFGMVWLERYKGFRKLGAAAASILFAMVLSNAGLIPGESLVYDFFTGYGVLAGTVLILLSVDLSSIKAAGSTMAKAFFIGAMGSAVGAMIMGFILYRSLGEESYKLSGQFAATYVGGGMNFAAIGHAFGTAEELFTAGIAADVIITAFWLVACLAAPILLKSAPEEAGGTTPFEAPSDESGHTLEKALYSSGKAVSLVDLGAIVAITVSSIWVSTLLAGRFPAIPAVFWLTTLALILAQLPPVKRLTGSTVIGNYLIMLFLACNGAKSVIAKIVEVGPEVFYFAVGTVGIHGVVIFGVGMMMRIDAGTLAIASQANIGGGTHAMAIATARGYHSRILPGVAVGIIGTALGNYLGLAVGNLMRILL
jgi:uncharacterized membrane protein